MVGLYDNFSQKDIINAKEMDAVPPKKNLEPAVDNAVSKIVGKKVYATDPRLLKLVVKFKKMKGNSAAQDNFLQNPKFRAELKKTFE